MENELKTSDFLLKFFVYFSTFTKITQNLFASTFHDQKRVNLWSENCENFEIKLFELLIRKL